MNKISFTIIQFLFLIDSTKQSHIRQGITTLKAIGKTIKSPLVRTIGNTIKKSVGMFNWKKNTIKNLACSLGGNYSKIKHNFGKKPVKYLGEQGIQILKSMAPQATRGGNQLVRALGKKNTQMRSGVLMSGKDVGSFINMLSKSKPQVPFLFAGGFLRIAEFSITKNNHPPLPPVGDNTVEIDASYENAYGVHYQEETAESIAKAEQTRQNNIILSNAYRDWLAVNQGKLMAASQHRVTMTMNKVPKAPEAKPKEVFEKGSEEERKQIAEQKEDDELMMDPKQFMEKYQASLIATKKAEMGKINAKKLDDSGFHIAQKTKKEIASDYQKEQYEKKKAWEKEKSLEKNDRNKKKEEYEAQLKEKRKATLKRIADEKKEYQKNKKEEMKKKREAEELKGPTPEQEMSDDEKLQADELAESNSDQGMSEDELLQAEELEGPNSGQQMTEDEKILKAAELEIERAAKEMSERQALEAKDGYTLEDPVKKVQLSDEDDLREYQ